MKFLIHLVTTFSPAHYFFSSSHEEELCDSEALRRNGTCSVHYSWPCFQLRLPARQMSAACDKQPVSSLRKLGWSGEVCRRKDTLRPGINIRKVADLGIFFFLLPLPIIKVIFQVSLALLLYLKFVISLEF